jgi:hypothetical protein
VETIQTITLSTLKRLGYRIASLTFPSTKRFDIIVTRGKRHVGINCFPREVNSSDVAEIAKHGGLAKECWIVCTGFNKNAEKLAKKEGIYLVVIRNLIERLKPRIRDVIWQRYVKLVNSGIDQTLYLKLQELLETVLTAKSAMEKGRSLEIFAEYFIKLFPKLEVIKKNVRLENEELDIVVKNENEKIFWQRLGTPIVVECKNWANVVGSSEIRDLVLKMREVKTSFLIATNGITHQNGAEYEILEARKKMKYILVFDLTDFQHILKGGNPEETVQDKFYSLWTGFQKKPVLEFS